MKNKHGFHFRGAVLDIGCFDMTGMLPSRTEFDDRNQAMDSGSVDGALWGARPDKTIRFSTNGVTVLTVERGKVTHHLDYADYETINGQLDAQLAH